MTTTINKPADAENTPNLRRDFDLRDWLLKLESDGRLAMMQSDINLQFELAGIANRNDGVRASVFPQPSNHSGTVISGLLSNRDWMAEALGVGPSELLSQYQHASSNPLSPKVVETAPCQEFVHNSDIDLNKILPIPTHNEHDSGAYITAGLFICKNPQTGIQNVAILRLQLSGPRELGVLILPRHTLTFFAAAEAEGEDLDVAIVIGASPACLLASQAIVPLDFDELGIAGALGNAPLEVVRCKSTDLLVPAASEIVIEGRILAQKRAPEGPFGEFPQYYGERAERHVIAVECVTHRKNPLFHTIVGGGLEHLLLGGIPREATILSSLQRNFPNVSDVHLSKGGVCRYHLYVQMDVQIEGEAKNVMLGAFAAHYDVKHVTVVDMDVNIHDPQMVEWAVATRFQADRDLVVISGSQGSKLDPSTDDGCGAKMGFDATIPFGAPEFKFKKIKVPGEEELDIDSVCDTDMTVAEYLHA